MVKYTFFSVLTSLLSEGDILLQCVRERHFWPHYSKGIRGAQS